MYKEVGKTLKTFAWINVIAFTGLFALIGMYVAAVSQAPEMFYIFFIALFGLIGYLIGQYTAIWVYAYGELVDSVAEIKKKICEQEESSQGTCE